MEVKRIVVDTLEIEDGLARLRGPLTKYIVTVLRKNPGERLDLIDREGRFYHCSIRTVKGREVVLDILSTELKQEVSRDRVTLCASPIKGARMDWLIEKATELGVDRVIPALFARTVVKADSGTREKYGRWRRIAREASRQSGRSSVPEITDPMPLQEILPYVDDVSNRWVFYEKEKEQTLKNIMGARKEGDIFIVTGPEGGIEESEIEWLKGKGFAPCSLGEHIFRSETAPLVVLSIILYEYLLK
ncbi:MAG TPA: 16S rRNA (uracil(1498)-N(3))-methyltransferase [Syntrophorhabdaceae bacterium]|jgi:16S rRNA (uracil1498-N3)-methyltransferase